MWCWGKKFYADALPAIARLPHVDNPAFLLFLCFRIGENKHFTAVDLVLHEKQAAVGVHHHGFADFAKFLAGLAPALRLDPDLVERPGASAPVCCDGVAHKAIIEWTMERVNCPTVQVFRKHNPCCEHPPLQLLAGDTKSPTRTLS